MKLLKFILAITAMLMVFAVINAKAETCVYTDGTEYDLSGAIQYKGNDLGFIKFCCDELGKCTSGYAARDKYYLTHIAAMYNRCDVLKYLVEEKNIPYDKFPANIKTGQFEYTKTQLMMSSENGSYDCTKYLVDKGASVTRTNQDGHDALYFAKESGNQKVINYVQSAWNKAKGYSYNQIEKEKAKLRNLLKPEAIQKHFAQNAIVQTTKPFIDSAAHAQDLKQI